MYKWDYRKLYNTNIATFDMPSFWNNEYNFIFTASIKSSDTEIS